jgi:2-polyprenyl-3-methyl-5-hydroxy-6-metoxy-1,4-benzoquinol methylase
MTGQVNPLSEERLAAVQLPRENVCGHTHKVVLFREACERVRGHRLNGRLRILDVGCGSGYAVTRFLGRPGDDVLGIDLYEPNIRYARQMLQRPGLQFECRSAETLLAVSETYDVIVLADILEHLTDPAAVLRNCRQLLREDGLLLITIPNGFGPFETESALARAPLLGPLLLRAVEYGVAVLNKFGPLRGKWTEALSEVPPDLPYNLESRHVQFFTRRRLAALSDSAGFRIVRIESLSFLAGPFTNFLFGASRAFCRWNVVVAASLPRFAASAWFFECVTAPPESSVP